MNYNRTNWTVDDYQQLLAQLDQQTDRKYQKFHQGLVPTGKGIRGIRTPLLKEIAKEISKGNYTEFFNQVKQNSYEEKILYGLVISYLKLPFEEILIHLNHFIIMIDNWAINDIVAANLKCFQKNQERGFQYIQSLLSSNQPWHIRFGLVLLLDHYINDTYIDAIFPIIESISNDDYYVKMANAWLLSICYIKYREKTSCFLKKTTIDDWTYQKAIRKICDSYRVSKEEKDILKKQKR